VEAISSVLHHDVNAVLHVTSCFFRVCGIAMRTVIVSVAGQQECYKKKNAREFSERQVTVRALNPSIKNVSMLVTILTLSCCSKTKLEAIIHVLAMDLKFLELHFLDIKQNHSHTKTVSLSSSVETSSTLQYSKTKL